MSPHGTDKSVSMRFRWCKTASPLAASDAPLCVHLFPVGGRCHCQRFKQLQIDRSPAESGVLTRRGLPMLLQQNSVLLSTETNLSFTIFFKFSFFQFCCFDSLLSSYAASGMNCGDLLLSIYSTSYTVCHPLTNL